MEYRLREWKIEDAKGIVRFADNEEIAANLRDAYPFPYTYEDALDYIESCVNASGEKQLCLAIETEGRAVGSVGIFLQEDVYRKSAELGYWLAEEYWGQGMMTGAVIKLCGEAFRRYDIVRIYAEPYAHNAGSRRVLEKAGFTLEGTMRSGVFKNNRIYDYCMYSLLKDEWKE